MTDNPHWLNPWRLRVYPRVVLACSLFFVAGWLAYSHHGLSPAGNKPLFSDHIAFWAASSLAIEGRPQAAYDVDAIGAFQHAAIAGNTKTVPWFYPPTFLLLVLPLSLLPYLGSCAVFLATTLAGYVAVVRRICSAAQDVQVPREAQGRAEAAAAQDVQVPREAQGRAEAAAAQDMQVSREARGRTGTAAPGSLVALIAFPGVLDNFVHGQTGFLTAALMGACLLCLRAHPLRSGVFAALLTIKPQLGLLLPLAMLCGRHYRAFAAAAVGSLAFLALAVGVFGASTLQAFVDSVPQAMAWVSAGVLPLDKNPTFFACARLLGAPPAIAWTLFGAVAAFTTVGVAWVWRQRVAFELQAAALSTGTLLTTAYLFDYDLAWLALPIAWLAVLGAREGWLKWEREVLVAVWLSPLLGLVGAGVAASFVMAVLFAVILRRVRHDVRRHGATT